jgi:hypothetical protein
VKTVIGIHHENSTPLVTTNDNDNDHILDNIDHSSHPEIINAEELGDLVSRNLYAHGIAGAQHTDTNGEVNYNLDLRGYNKDGALVGRERDKYAGNSLWHDGTDALFVYSSGSTTTVSNQGLANESTAINFEAGETMRIKVDGTGTAIGSRTVTFERRTNDSTPGSSDAVWAPYFQLSA